MGGSVLMSKYFDRKAAGHLAKTAGARSLVLNFRRSPEHKYPAQVDDGQDSFIMGAGRADEVDRAIGEMGSWLRSTLGLQTAVA
jgi:acetyl esterase/lipase